MNGIRPPDRGREPQKPQLLAWLSVLRTSYFVLGTGCRVLLFRVAKSGLVVAKTKQRLGLRWWWGGFTLLGLAVRQLADRAGTTERRYRASTGRPGPSGSWSFGRRGSPERAKASADAPSGLFASRGARLARRISCSCLGAGYFFVGSRNLGWWSRKRSSVSACGGWWLCPTFSSAASEATRKWHWKPRSVYRKGRPGSSDDALAREQRTRRPSGRLERSCEVLPGNGEPFRKGRAL